MILFTVTPWSWISLNVTLRRPLYYVYKNDLLTILKRARRRLIVHRTIMYSDWMKNLCCSVLSKGPLLLREYSGFCLSVSTLTCMVGKHVVLVNPLLNISDMEGLCRWNSFWLAKQFQIRSHGDFTATSVVAPQSYVFRTALLQIRNGALRTVRTVCGEIGCDMTSIMRHEW